jgi:hypothetical protein
MILGELDRGLVQKDIGVRNGFDLRMAKHAEINFPRSIGASWESAWRVRNLHNSWLWRMKELTGKTWLFAGQRRCRGQPGGERFQTHRPASRGELRLCP